MEFEIVHWLFLSQWDFILYPLFCHISEHPGNQMTRIVPLYFPVSKARRSFVGDKANNNFQAFLKVHSWFLMFIHEKVWTIKYHGSLLKYIHVTWKESSFALYLPSLAFHQAGVFVLVVCLFFNFQTLTDTQYYVIFFTYICN